MKFFLFISIFLLNLYANVLDFRTLQSDFVQTITNDQNSTITYKGKFYTTDTKKALWIYNTPVKKEVYFNNNQVAIVEPELEQVIVTTLKNSPNITEIIKNAKKIGKNRFETTYEDTTYYINTKDGQMESITYKDKLENSVKITLKNVEKNTVLDDALFKLRIPNGYDIVTQ